MPRHKAPAIPDALLDQLLDGGDPRAAFNPDGVIDALKKKLAERMLNAAMDHYLGSDGANGLANTRNGCGQETVLTDTGRLALDITPEIARARSIRSIARFRVASRKLRQMGWTAPTASMCQCTGRENL